MNWKVMDLGRRGIRSLAVARTNDEGKWQMLGILTFLDPPRPDTKDTIEKSMALGVDVKMITGGAGGRPVGVRGAGSRGGASRGCAGASQRGRRSGLEEARAPRRPWPGRGTAPPDPPHPPSHPAPATR